MRRRAHAQLFGRKLDLMNVFGRESLTLTCQGHPDQATPEVILHRARSCSEWGRARLVNAIDKSPRERLRADPLHFRSREEASGMIQRVTFIIS